MATPRSSMAWGPLISAMVAGAALTGVIVWRINLQSLEGGIEEKRKTLSKLTLRGDIPPNEEVQTYLTTRQASLEERHQHWREAVSAPPMTQAAEADPQLYVQERFHEVQQTLERLAAAHAMPAPQPLGFPTEIPPVETVPRLLTQLVLIEEAATLILDQGVTALASLRVEDPEVVPGEEADGTVLARLPVRVRLTGSLAELMTILGMFERVKPLIDVRGIRVARSASPNTLEAELVLARYLGMAAAPVPIPTDRGEGATTRRRRRRKRPRPPAIRAESEPSSVEEGGEPTDEDVESEEDRGTDDKTGEGEP